MTKDELKAQRTDYIRRADVIVSKAEAETRGLSAEEKQKFDAQMTEVEKIDRELESRSYNVPAVARSLEPDRRAVDLRVPVLRRDQSVASYLAATGTAPTTSDTDGPFSLGACIRAAVTGNRADLSPLEQRALEAGTGVSGGFLLGDQMSAIVIDRLRPFAQVFTAGALTVPMSNSTLTLARLDNADAPTWHAENTDDIADSNMRFGQVVLTARTLPVIATMSIELFEDLAPGQSSAVIENEMLKALALELDRAALRGTGLQKYPLGLLNRPSVVKTTLGAGSGLQTTDWDWAVDAIGRIWAQNLEPNAYITSSAVAVRTEKYKSAGAGADGQPLNPPRVIANLPRLITNQIPANLTVGSSTDCSEAYFGKWDEMLIGIRTNTVFEVSRTAGDAFKKMQVIVRAYLRADVAVSHGEAFQVVLGLRA